jgi:hypothetical protein
MSIKILEYPLKSYHEKSEKCRRAGKPEFSEPEKNHGFLVFKKKKNQKSSNFWFFGFLIFDFNDPEL